MDAQGVIAVVVIVAFVAICAIAIAFHKEHKCTICGNTSHRKVFLWTLKGEEHRVCSDCNRTLMAQQRKSAIKRFIE